jgi:hypothetical protein
VPEGRWVYLYRKILGLDKIEKIWYNTPNGKQYKMNVLKLVGEGAKI